MTARVADVAVLGAGVVGLATTVALADRGAEVVCFEAGRPGGGQSAGSVRLFRHRHDDPRLIALAVLARQGWSAWERRAGVCLLGRDGVLRLGEDAEVAHASLRARSIAAELVDSARQRCVLPGFQPPGEVGLLETDAGAIRARTAISATSSWVADRLLAAEVHAIGRHGPGGVRLITSEGVWNCRSVVVCAGVNTPRFADSLGWRVPIAYGLHPRVAFRIRERFLKRIPAGLQDGSGAHGDTVYGAPRADGRHYVVGRVGPDADAPAGAPVAEIARRVRLTQAYVSRALAALDPQPAGVRVCITTKLPGGKDAFGVWQDERVLLVAGNNLFKFAPTLGGLLAEAASTGRLPAALPRGAETVAPPRA